MKIPVLLAVATAATAFTADKPVTFLAEPGKSILMESFAGNAIPDGWRAGKGKWEVAGGAIKGVEIPEDKHGAVIRKQLKFKDVVIAFDVRFDGARGASLSINDAKEHVARLLLTAAGFTVRRDDHDHDGPDKAVTFGTVKTPLNKGEWHAAVIEIVGDTMLASLDGRNPAFGSDPLIGTDKANIGFTVAGESASFRNLRVWEATKKPDWDETKAKLSGVKK